MRALAMAIAILMAAKNCCQLRPSLPDQKLVSYTNKLLDFEDSWEERLKPVAKFGEASPAAELWLSESLKATRSSMGHLLDQKFGAPVLEHLKITYERMLSHFSAGGALSLDAAALSEIIAMDKAAEIMRIDVIAGVSVVLAKLSQENANFWESKKFELASLAAALPAFHGICICESKHVAYTHDPGDGGLTTRLEAYLTAFADVLKFVGCLTNNSTQAREVLPKFTAYKDRHIEIIAGMVEQSLKHCQAIQNNIGDLLIDLDPYIRDSSKLPDLVGFANRVPLMQALKILNGADGKGLKMLDRLILALSGSGVKTAGGMIIETVRNQIVAMRQKGRLLLCIRTAASIIVGKKVDDVDKLNQEAKKLKVTFPKSIRQQLEHLDADSNAD